MSFVNASFLWLLIPLGLYLWQREVKQSLQQNLRWVALGLLILAVARPAIPQAPTQERLEARSLVIALDLSASMRGEDISPNRLAASKATIHAFLAQNAYDQIALIGFTINPLLLSPPTTDHPLVATALDTLREEYVLTKGTDIYKLLEKVAQLPDREKLLVLFSDGGDEVMDAGLSSFAKEQRIQVLAIAMASNQGASIPTNNQALLKDAEGNIVVSKLSRSLASFARST
ncbi:MAG TPA: VWA domain-containing protein, partial [Campylobacterales bacterium]|nr:VWA domain-containing protein [Campylobacterales bacterium]